MRAAGVLAAYALVIACGLPTAMSWRGWTLRSPQLGLVGWLIGLASALAAALFAATALAVPAFPLWPTELVHACLQSLLNAHAVTSASPQAAIGMLVAVAIGTRAGSCVITHTVRSRRHRRRHRSALAMLTGGTRCHGALILDSPVAAAYCVPGLHPQIVLSRGAIEALTPAELIAVLAHEHAHLQGRHHVLVELVEGLARAFPRVPLTRTAAIAIPGLLEIRADEAAIRASDRQTVARALLQLSGKPVPASALGAAGPLALVRVQRLVDPPMPLGYARVALALAISGIVLAMLTFVAASPAAAALATHRCPVPLHTQLSVFPR